MKAWKAPTEEFEPGSMGLSAGFRLTDYTRLKGCGCKIPQVDLLKLLEGIGDGKIGMDCSIMPTRHGDLKLVSTTDFFYPLIEDPYLQGRIACANVLSDMYSMGVRDVDNMLMILGASTDMNAEDQHICTRQLILGFHDTAREAGTHVTGGQSVLNPWPIIGGVAMSTCADSEIIVPVGAQAGDLLVLTKPLGTQLAVNAHQWMDKPEKWKRISDILDRDRVLKAFNASIESMGRLNFNAARCMHTHGAHAATDVTGFGILGHADNLASNQDAEVDLELHTLPIIADMELVDEVNPEMFKLLQGYSAETSGGLLVCVPAATAQAFVDELSQLDGQPAWIIGRVVPRKGDSNAARLVDGPKVLRV